MFHKSALEHRMILRTAIWSIGIIAMICSFLYFYTPIYASELTNPANPGFTEPLLPGTTVTQTFISDKQSIEGMEFAFSYDDNISPDATAVIRVYQDDTLVVEQPLAVSSTQNQTFLYLSTHIPKCLGKVITLEIENTSKEAEHTFSLLTASPLSFRPSNLDNYSFHTKEQDTCLLFRLTYCTGYTYYNALSVAAFMLLITLAASSLVTSKRLHK